MLSAEQLIQKESLAWVIGTLKSKNQDILFRRLAKDALKAHGERATKSAISALADQIRSAVYNCID